MPAKLLSTRWYIVDLDTKCVATDRNYPTCMKALDAETERHRLQHFTALTGKHILAHVGHPWIIPATLEEAEDQRDLASYNDWIRYL